MEEKLVVNCDGGSRGNPGPAASAFVISIGEKVIYQEGKYIGINTNNVAEYGAVKMAIVWLSENFESLPKHQEIIFNLDSQLVERQLNNFYKIKNSTLSEYAFEIKKIISANNLKIKFVWGFRSNNTIADNLVNEVLDKTLQK